MIRLGDMST
jgi:hypothetical protein